jgi:hypothetical protein
MKNTYVHDPKFDRRGLSPKGIADLAASIEQTCAYVTSKDKARNVILFAFAALQDIADRYEVTLYLPTDPNQPPVTGSVNFDTMMAACDVLEGKEVA